MVLFQYSLKKEATNLKETTNLTETTNLKNDKPTWSMNIRDLAGKALQRNA